MREKEQRLKPTCMFCRQPVPKIKIIDALWSCLMKRLDSNDPLSLQSMGGSYFEDGEYEKAHEY